MVTMRSQMDAGSTIARVLLADDGRDWDEDVLAALASDLYAQADGPARVVLLTVEPGVLTRPWATALLTDRDAARAPLRLSAVVQTVAEAPLPMVVLLDGDVTGPGLELALAGDVRLASERARFGFPSVQQGAPPLAGGVARLARHAGRAAALQMLLTGDLLDSARALACGLVSGVYPFVTLAEQGERLAGVLAGRGPIALRYAKEAVTRGMEMPLDQALRYETDLTILLQATADRAEGVRAFAEKRQPMFEGR